MFLLFNPSLNIYAAETVCEANDRYCTGNVRYKCNSSYSGYDVFTCPCGCYGGYCSTCPTPIPLPECSTIGGFCTGGQTCIIVEDGYMNAGYNCPDTCCKRNYCSDKWPGSTCTATNYCKSPLGTASADCLEAGFTCCSDKYIDECTSNDNCVDLYGSCYRCNTSVIPKKCYSYTNSGTNGSCGGSNGQTVCSTDISATCSAGNATAAFFNGVTWSWSCNGIKASSCAASVNNASCTATKAADIDGVCGVSQGTSSCFAPTADLCSTGSPSAVSTNTSTNVFSWSCSKQCSGTAPNCTSTRLVINGSCGAADGGNFTSTPTQLCAVGTASAVAEPTTTSYTWSCNRNCNGNIDYCSAVHDLAPNLASTVLKNASGTVVAVEVGGRNHSCDANFGSSKTNIWTITASDANGLADVKEISLRFRSATNTYTYGPTATVNGVASFTVDTTSFAVGTYNVETLIDDIHSPNPANRGWLDTGRDFKIWDCQVKVNGTIYDNSANLACNNSNTAGFTQTIPVDVDPFEFVYGDRFDGSTKEMTVSSPNFRNPETLTWQREYFLDTFDVDDSNFSGVFKTLKINDVCLPSNSFTVPRNHVNAYDADPTINIKYGAIMDQESWFRTEDGTVISKVEARNYVPVTCVDDCMTTINGIVWSKNVNTPKSNDESLWSEIQPKTDPNTYTALKYDIKSGLNIGTTFVVDTTYGKTSLNWSEIKDTREIIFIDGDFTIDEDINISPSEYLLIIVSGKITILPNVNIVEGMFFANTTIEASGDSNTQLVINGSLYGKNGVILSRTYTKKRDNNTNPAVRVVYDPNLIFKLPQRMWETYENWRME